MRTVNLTNSVVGIPDELVFAFKHVIVRAVDVTSPTISVAKMVVTLTYGTESHAATYYAMGGAVYADVSAFVQSFFDPSSFGVDYTSAVSDAGTYVDGISITVAVTYDDDSVETTTAATFMAVWGAEDYGGDDDFFALRELRWWPAYPFTLGVYMGASGAAAIGTTAYNVGRGISNVLPPATTAVTINAYTIEGGIIDSTFDDTFDITFAAAGGEVLGVAKLHVDNDHDEGVYLRWIDRHGFYAYWLFKVRDVQFTTEQEKAFERADFAAYTDVYGFVNAAGHRQAVRRGKVMPVCAPLVNSDTYDYLLDIASSPVVDMYAGTDDDGAVQWEAVGVQVGTWTKTDEDLQDFLINIQLPYTPTQRL